MSLLEYIAPDVRFVTTNLGQIINQMAHEKGFYTPGVERNFGEIIALIHSELSEALEGYRHGNPKSDHIPEFSAIEEELADAVIRILDTAFEMKLRLAEAIIAKIEFNATRPYKHGKKC